MIKVEIIIRKKFYRKNEDFERGHPEMTFLQEKDNILYFLEEELDFESMQEYFLKIDNKLKYFSDKYEFDFYSDVIEIKKIYYVRECNY